MYTEDPCDQIRRLQAEIDDLKSRADQIIDARRMYQNGEILVDSHRKPGSSNLYRVNKERFSGAFFFRASGEADFHFYYEVDIVGSLDAEGNPLFYEPEKLKNPQLRNLTVDERHVVLLEGSTASSMTLLSSPEESMSEYRRISEEIGQRQRQIAAIETLASERIKQEKTAENLKKAHAHTVNAVLQCGQLAVEGVSFYDLEDDLTLDAGDFIDNLSHPAFESRLSCAEVALNFRVFKVEGIEPWANEYRWGFSYRVSIVGFYLAIEVDSLQVHFLKAPLPSTFLVEEKFLVPLNSFKIEEIF